jgi:hypothetical protein
VQTELQQEQATTIIPITEVADSTSPGGGQRS